MDREDLINITKSLDVLYVEDEESTRIFMTMLFQNYFNSVVEACDGEEAMDLYNKKYKIVITDRNLPKKNGDEIIEEILEKNSDQIFILISADNNREWNPKIDRRVFSLNKPIVIEEFDKILERVLG